MTRAQAEEIFTTCTAVVKVLGGDLRELCRSRGIPDNYIDEFLQREDRREVYDRFFQVHDRSGQLNLSEKEIVEKLRNFGIPTGVDKSGNKWIKLPSNKYPNSIELHLCKTLETKYGYQYR
jgi:hypothetical protein